MTRDARYTPEEREQMESCILMLLARGPMSTKALATAFGLNQRNLSWFLGDMQKKKWIARFGRDRGGRTWRSLAAPAPKVSLAVAKSEWKYIDEEHRQWMAYWQTPKVERLRLRQEQQR